MLGLNNNSFHRGEEIIDTFRPRFLIHSKAIFLKLVGVIILIYSFGFLVNIMYYIQSKVINIIHLPLVQYSIYFIIFVVFVVILWVIYDLINWYAKKYILTNQRIISQDGLIRKKKSSIVYEKIEDITIFQNLSSRLVSAGTIHIYGGHDEMHVVLEDVPNPDDIEEEINKLMSDSWRRNRHNNSKRNNRYRNNLYDYDNYDDFDYIDRTSHSKQYPVNTFDDSYDDRYGYDEKSDYYNERSYNDYYEPPRHPMRNNYSNRNSDYKDYKHKNPNFKNNPNNYDNDFDNVSFEYNNTKKLSFDDPKFWEDDYPEEQVPKNYSKSSKQSRETFKKNRKKAMDRHSERFKRH